jgi:hypothetical protein
MSAASTTYRCLQTCVQKAHIITRDDNDMGVLSMINLVVLLGILNGLRGGYTSMEQRGASPKVRLSCSGQGVCVWPDTYNHCAWCSWFAHRACLATVLATLRMNGTLDAFFC